MSMLQLQLAQGLWTPSALLAPPKIWVDHSTAVTDVGGNASQWNDRSANAWHFTQGTAGSRPLIVASGLNGYRTLRWDGTADIMLAAGATGIMQNTGQGWSFAVVKKMTTDVADTERSMLFISTAGSTVRFAHSIGSSAVGTANKPSHSARRLDGDAFARLPHTGAVPTVGAFHMLLNTQDWSTGAGTLWIDGTQVASNATLTSAGLTSNTASTGVGLGAAPSLAQFADMELAAIIIGSGSLPSAGEIDRLFGYAAWQYALTSLLPGGHAYKTAPPQ